MGRKAKSGGKDIRKNQLASQGKHGQWDPPSTANGIHQARLIGFDIWNSPRCRLLATPKITQTDNLGLVNLRGDLEWFVVAWEHFFRVSALGKRALAAKCPSGSRRLGQISHDFSGGKCELRPKWEKRTAGRRFSGSSGHASQRKALFIITPATVRLHDAGLPGANLPGSWRDGCGWRKGP